MTQREDEDILYECDCFRIVRFVDDEGSANVSISFFDHGLDLYLSDEEFGHFAEAVGIGALPDSMFGDAPYYTDWMDTEESERLLRYQRQDFQSYSRDLYDRMRWTRLLVRPLRWPIRRYLERKSASVLR